MLFSAILTALGLSGAAGLNAYVPLFIVGLLGRIGLLHLAPPYSTLSSLPILLLLVVLLIIELVVDKIPGIDHINDIVQTFIRPAAGAILFASATGIVGLDPRIALAIGLITALSVHGVKAGLRPIVNVTTLGLGASVVSVLEDIVSFLMTVAAIFVPILTLLFFTGIGFVAYRLHKRRRSTGRARPGTFNKAYRRKKRLKNPPPPETPASVEV